MNSFTKADIFLSVFVQNWRTLNVASTRYSPMGHICISKYRYQYNSLSAFISVRAALESMIQDKCQIRKIRERAVLKKCQNLGNAGDNQENIRETVCFFFFNLFLNSQLVLQNFTTARKSGNIILTY